jgi:hypothetical protein
LKEHGSRVDFGYHLLALSPADRFVLGHTFVPIVFQNF